MKTYVFLTRHAKAIDPYESDFERPLSEEGIIIQKKLAKLLKEEEIIPDVIYTSSFYRAKQSAEILAKELSSSVVEDNALGKEFDEYHLLNLIKRFQGKTIFMVGHAPTMAFFINQLTKTSPIKDSLEKSSGALIVFQREIEFRKGDFIRMFSLY